ncbi:MAG: DsbA oxidoreductase [uncultured bacterium]|nr:MAG: DsbA oxidoreductase [uncultured bacterium]KKT02826.1 MAG: DSBA oxidoreductase [Candidatus Peregrinibacteria bacterium GW2011_GWF2_43_17]HAU39666.1 hypothetical protein [Candidatus Peregrinibacteria bacterium]
MENQNKQGGVVWMLSTFALIGVLVGLGISSLDGGSSGQTNITGPSADTQDQNYELPTVDDDPVMGDESAPVTMIVFSEYECPYCQRFETETFSSIKADFIDTGKVKLVYRDYPLPIHDKAHLAAEAGECASDSVSYWDYQAKLIEKYTEWSEYTGEIKELFSDYAKELGVDYDTFYACLEDGTYYDEVESDMTDARAAGVMGTPSFFINDEKVMGALPYEDYADQNGEMQEGFKSILTRIYEEATK